MKKKKYILNGSTNLIFNNKVPINNANYKLSSLAGKIYEWDRGVIGVSYNGNVVKQALDKTLLHHVSGTLKIIKLIGYNIAYTSSPFDAAVKGSKLGVLVFQFEGDHAFIYFPMNLSNKQYNELENILKPRMNFNYSFVHNEDIHEEQTVQDVIEYAQNITNLSNEVVKSLKI